MNGEGDYPDWSMPDPCPECGSEEFLETVISQREIDNTGTVKHRRIPPEQLHIECNECETTLWEVDQEIQSATDGGDGDA
jgi:uncharacterized Zn finger protein